MPEINKDAQPMALINAFEVEPDQCDALLAVLIEAADNVMHHLDGFISASFHKSLDGRYLTNFAQWQSRTHFEAMLEHPDAQAHMEKASQIASDIKPIQYEVVSTHGG